MTDTATIDKVNPITQSNFKIEVEGLNIGDIIECIFVDTPFDIFKNTLFTQEHGKIILKWEATDVRLNELFHWRMEVANGKIARKNITIILNDSEGREFRKWTLMRAYPVKYIPPNLNAKSNEVAIETIEICHDGMIF